MSKLYGQLFADGGTRYYGGRRYNVNKTKRAHREIIAQVQTWQCIYRLVLCADGTCALERHYIARDGSMVAYDEKDVTLPTD